MLVLSRKIDESIILGDDITVTVLGIDGDRVSLGIDAPRSVKIFRSELIEETKRVNQEALSIPNNIFSKKIPPGNGEDIK